MADSSAQESYVQEPSVQGAVTQNSTTDDSNPNDPANTDAAAISDKPYGPPTKGEHRKECARPFLNHIGDIV